MTFDFPMFPENMWGLRILYERTRATVVLALTSHLETWWSQTSIIARIVQDFMLSLPTWSYVSWFQKTKKPSPRVVVKSLEFFFLGGGFGKPCHVTANALEGFHQKSSGVLVEMTVTQSSTPCSSAQGKWHSGE